MAKAKPAVKAPVKAKSAAAVKTALTVVEPAKSTPVASRPSGGIALPAGVKVVKNVTLPSLVMKTIGERHILCFISEMRISTIKDKPDASGKQREPATIADVGDTETGEQFIFLVPTVVKANLLRDYPDGSYVGKSFYIEHMGKRNESQRYVDFRILEVDVSEIGVVE